MHKLLKIDSVMYRVSDLKTSEAFYVNVLGLRKVWEDLEVGMIGFVFEQSDSEIVIHTDSTIPKGEHSYLVDDVVGFCEELKKQGQKVLLEPMDVRSGKYAVVADPDGNEISVIDLSKFDGKPKYDSVP